MSKNILPIYIDLRVTLLLFVFRLGGIPGSYINITRKEVLRSSLNYMYTIMCCVTESKPNRVRTK